MSVEFEPVKLGPRRRRVDPVVIGAVVVLIGVVAAVVKPWDASVVPANNGLGVEFVESSPAPSPLPPSAGPSSTAVPVRSTKSPESTASFGSWDKVRAVVRPHDAWGIRAIVGRPSALLAATGDLRFDEIWNRWPNAASTATPIDIEPNDQTVVAVGITFPASHTPIDVRIWLIHPDRLEWIDTQPLDSSPSGGGFLYRVTGADGSIQNWAAGRYRIDVLVDGAIRRFGFTLPNRFEIVPDRAEPPPEQGDLIDPAGGALPDLPIGLFVTASGVSIPLSADEGPPLTEAGSWLNVDPGTGRAPRSRVATSFVPAATGLGVTLPPGSVVQRSSVKRLAPEPLPVDPELVRDDRATPGSTAHVLYRAPGRGAWAAGVYQVSVAWTDSAGRHAGSWLVELRPGPVRELPSMLLAARGFARYAGSSGVVVGTAEPLEGGPRSVAIRLLRTSPEPASPTIPRRDRVPCDGVRIDAFAGVIGLAGPPGAPPPNVMARVLFEFNRSGEQPLLTAAGDVPGLTLFAPAGVPPLPSDAYQLRVDDTTNPIGPTVCLTVTPAG